MKELKICKQNKHKEFDSDVNIALDILLCKLDRIEEKLDRIEEKLDRFEEKIGRKERN